MLPGVDAAAGYEPRSRAALQRALPDAAAQRQIWRPRARASSARCPPRLDGALARCAQRSIPPTPKPAASWPSPTGPRRICDDPEPFVRAFERSFCAPGRAAAPAYFAPGGALALAGGPHPRPLDTPLARLPAQAVARFWRLRLGSDGVLDRRLGGQRLDGGPQPRHEHVDVRRRTVASSGSSLRFDPAVPRMVAA